MVDLDQCCYAYFNLDPLSFDDNVNHFGLILIIWALIYLFKPTFILVIAHLSPNIQKPKLIIQPFKKKKKKHKLHKSINIKNKLYLLIIKKKKKKKTRIANQSYKKA